MANPEVDSYGYSPDANNVLLDLGNVNKEIGAIYHRRGVSGFSDIDLEQLDELEDFKAQYFFTLISFRSQGIAPFRISIQSTREEKFHPVSENLVRISRGGIGAATKLIDIAKAGGQVHTSETILELIRKGGEPDFTVEVYRDSVNRTMREMEHIDSLRLTAGNRYGPEILRDAILTVGRRMISLAQQAEVLGDNSTPITFASDGTTPEEMRNIKISIPGRNGNDRSVVVPLR